MGKDTVILVVDDERDHADGIVEALDKSCAKAIAVYNGKDALEILRSEKVDVVVTDLKPGSGIAADKLPNIFDAYYSSRPQGSGLGLPTTKKIVEAHNGTIAVNSEPGKGTSFTIKLPVQCE